MFGFINATKNSTTGGRRRGPVSNLPREEAKKLLDPPA
jgi:hypothetical protein